MGGTWKELKKVPKSGGLELTAYVPMGDEKAEEKVDIDCLSPPWDS